MKGTQEERLKSLKKYANRLTTKPGIYMMLNSNDVVIYIGKAKNLKNRVSSYFTHTKNAAKTDAILEKIHKIEFTITQTEREALILENSLIKEHKPKFNVLLKDSKSYPFIEVSISDKYPKVAFHRGKKNHSKAKYFGPYPNVNAVRSTISQLQKIFQLRNCDQSFFKNRSRPCLQHQIKRCSAPCVGLINEEDYSFSVFQAMEYLKGNNQNIINQLIEKMDQASSLQNYEKALIFRDQISSLKAIQAHQYADGGKPINLDAISLTRKSDIFCIAVLFVRAGRILGSRTFFPVKTEFADESEVLESFLTQYYLMHEPPKEILIDKKLINIKVIQETFSSVKGIKIAIKNNYRAQRRKWVDMAKINSKESLSMKLLSKVNNQTQLKKLTQVLSMDDPLTNIECFDVSHTMGEKCMASCVSFNVEGLNKKNYRRFNITGIKPGDDYAAIYQAVTRHYSRIIKENKTLPDLIVIDGGKGQLSSASNALKELGIGHIKRLGIAKGETRKNGNEKIFYNNNKTPLPIENNSSAMFLLQNIRDEAHRFAITGHRSKKRKTLLKSDLETIEGIGPLKKKNLMQQFGGLQEIKRASVEDLMTVNGINKELALRVYKSLST